MSIIAAFAVLVLGATSALAGAHDTCYWSKDAYTGANNFKHWEPTKTVITLSDRSGYDLNEYEAGYSWGSYSGDNVAIAYTQADTCTWCIRIVTMDTASNRVEVGQYKDEFGWGAQCTIKVDPDWANVNTYWRDRQYEMARNIGHCLGFERANPNESFSIMQSSGFVLYYPTQMDYDEMSAHYGG